MRAGRPALTRLVGASATEDFGAEHWGRTAYLAGVEDRGGDVFDDLFSLDAVDELVSDRGLRTPFLRVAKDGSTLPESAFTASGGTGAAMPDQVDDSRLLRLFDDGATLVLQGLHRTWGPIRDFAADLAADLGSPVQVNAYITPAANQGFDDHYDVHDVFVLQVHGTKRWSLREPVLDQPLRTQPWTDRTEQVRARADEEPFLETTLRPGDCLYLPRGWIHSARAQGEISAHLTIGVHAWTRHHLATQLLDLASRGLGDADQVRQSLPLGTQIDDPGAIADDVEVVREALVRAVQEMPAAAVAQALHRTRLTAERPAPVRPLRQLAAADALAPDTELVLRRHLVPTLSEADGRVTLRSRVAGLSLPRAYRPALELLLDGAPVTARALGHAAGLDDAETLDLARGLVRRGIATVSAVDTPR